jgi:hypothetical protein
MKVEIQTRQGLMPAHCAVPATPPPWPGVVVIHDFTGMSHDLRAQADWLAAEGFLALAPDLYYWGSRLRCLRTIMRDIGQRRGGNAGGLPPTRRRSICDSRNLSRPSVTVGQPPRQRVPGSRTRKDGLDRTRPSRVLEAVGLGGGVGRSYSTEVQQRPRTAASSDDRQHTQLAGTTAKRPEAPLVRGEEAAGSNPATPTRSEGIDLAETSS